MITQCMRCGRKLTSAKSVALGLGPSCATKFTEQQIRNLQLLRRESTEDQLADAAVMVTLGRVVLSANGRIGAAMNNEGRVYRFDIVSGNCNCAFGIHRHRAVRPTLKNGKLGACTCKHVIGGRLLAAA